MRISVFGIGYVGAVSAACLAHAGHQVIAVDVNPQKVNQIAEGYSPIIEPGLDSLIRQEVTEGRLTATTSAAQAVSDTAVSIVCVGTPSLPGGGLDTSYLKRACQEIATALRHKSAYHMVMIRSTMLPNTTRRFLIPLLEDTSGRRAGEDFGVCFCPEFLREGSALRDYHEPGMIVASVTDPTAESFLHEVYANLDARLMLVDFAVAEMLKYATNTWHATKVVFANEIGTVCKAQNVDGRAVMDLLCTDKRLNISPAYMRPGFAFGGSCLPKDIRALIHQAKRYDVECPMIQSLLPSNQRHIERALALVQDAGNQKVGLIGLSFKPGTDDLRESPTVELAERLLGKGYALLIYDPCVALPALMGSNLDFIARKMPHLAALVHDELDTVAAHADTIIVAHADRELQLPQWLYQDKVVIDLWTSTHLSAQPSGRYHGICW